MTRWDWKSILGYLPLATSLYSPKNLRKRAEFMQGAYSRILLQLAKDVEEDKITPWEAQRFVHAEERRWAIR